MTEKLLKIKNKILLHPFLLMLAACLASAAVFDISADKYTAGFIVFLGVSFGLIAFLGIFWYKKGVFTERKAVFLIMCAAFLVRLAYITATGLTERQHDIGSFRASSIGHAGNITRLYEGTLLPEEIKGQGYHPPLHYAIEALWLRLQTLLGASFSTATHYVTIPTMFYSLCTSLLAYKTSKLMGFRAKGALIVLSITAFHPTLIILAGSYNNDMLSVLFMIFAMYFTVKWWKEGGIYNILMIAVGIGLGMMSKLSAAYIAPAVAVVFLIKFIESKQKARLFGEYCAFGAVCVPAGMWWSVYMLVCHNKPLGYVMKLSAKLDQYIGFRSASERIFGVIDSLSEGIYFARGSAFGNSFFEYNIPSAILKTSVFGEWQVGAENKITTVLAEILFIVNIAVICLAIFCMIYSLFVKTGGFSGRIKAFVYFFYFTVMVLFVKFCFDYPHNCTMDFRYIFPTVIIGAIAMGGFTESEHKTSAGKKAETVLVYATAVFCVVSSALYILAA